MSRISYIDDNIMMGRCFLSRDYYLIRDYILQEKSNLDTVFCDHGELYGFQVSVNQPLTDLYESPFYVVKFIFSSAETLHTPEQEEKMDRVCANLARFMDSQKGYYNIRVPSHIVDLIKAFNKKIHGAFFCGGTVEEIHVGEVKELAIHPELNLFFADSEFMRKNRAHLEQLAYDSFANYQGDHR